MPYIGRDAQTAQSQNKIIDDISSSFNGSTTSFALLVGGVAPAPFPVTSQNLLISVGGVIQEPDGTGTNGYQLTGANIVFSAAPASGQSFFGVILAGADYVNAGANFPDGDAGTPSITFSQDLDTGLFRSGTGTTSFTSNNNRIADFGTTEIVFNEDGDDINFRVEGDTEANLLFVDAGNDLVGIGTSSPDETLHLNKSDSSGVSLKFTNSTATTGLFVGINSSEEAQIFYTENKPIKFATNNAERLRLTSGGELLVGTTAQNSFNGVASAHQFIVAGSTSDTDITDNSGASITISNTDGTADNTAGLHFAREDTDGNPHYCGASVVAQFVETQVTGQYPKADLAFLTSTAANNAPSEKMRIAANGQIYIHTTGSFPGAGNTNVGAHFEKASNGTTIFVSRGDSLAAYFNRNQDGELVRFQRSGNGVGNVSITATSTTYNTSSDYRLKENVVSISDGITRVKQLAPKRFNFIVDPDKTVDGFLAHEAQAVVPEAVTGTHNEVDDDGNAVMQGIDQSKLVPLLTAALQEAIAKIETLEAKVAALEEAS